MPPFLVRLLQIGMVRFRLNLLTLALLLPSVLIAALALAKLSAVQAGGDSVALVEQSLEAIEVDMSTQAQIAQAAASDMQGQAQGSKQMIATMGGLLEVADRNASACVQLSASISETNRTIDELTHLAVQLRDMTRAFRLA